MGINRRKLLSGKSQVSAEEVNSQPLLQFLNLKTHDANSKGVVGRRYQKHCILWSKFWHCSPLCYHFYETPKKSWTLTTPSSLPTLSYIEMKLQLSSKWIDTCRHATEMNHTCTFINQNTMFDWNCPGREHNGKLTVCSQNILVSPLEIQNTIPWICPRRNSFHV